MSRAELDFSAELSKLSERNAGQILERLTAIANDRCSDDSISSPYLVVKDLEDQVLQGPDSKKLLVLRALDAIVSNCEFEEANRFYRKQLAEKLPELFLSAMKVCDDSGPLLKLRQGWDNVFPSSQLEAIDRLAKAIDTTWPSASSPIKFKIASGKSTKETESRKSAKPVIVVRDTTADNAALPIKKRKLGLPAKENVDPTAAEISAGPVTYEAQFMSASAAPPPRTRSRQEPGPWETYKSKKSSKAIGEYGCQACGYAHSPMWDCTSGRSTLPAWVDKTEVLQNPEKLVNQAAHKLAQNELSKREYEDIIKGIIQLRAVATQLGYSAWPQPGQQMVAPQQAGATGYCGFPPPAARVYQPGEIFFEQGNPDKKSTFRFDRDSDSDSDAETTAEDIVAATNALLHGKGTEVADPIPKNKFIYVDGREHSVTYVEGIAVIEKSGEPHRIYFVGPAREVTIDGVPYLLGFNERKTVIIDGESHVMRFGGPSQELVLGTQPLRGSFGGPTIHLRINGIEHRIQISGPPPEVKIDDEPAHELRRFMPGQHRAMYRPVNYSGAAVGSGMQTRASLVARGFPPNIQTAPASAAMSANSYGFPTPQHHPYVGANMPAQPPASYPRFDQPQQPSVPRAEPNVEHLLTRLVKAGLVPDSGNARSQSPAYGIGVNSGSNATADAAGPPKTGLNLLFSTEADIERKSKAPKTLRDFSMKDLRIRYADALERLYPTGQQCLVCGLRYRLHQVELYSLHLDYHFLFAKNANPTPVASVEIRDWCMYPEEWVRYSEEEQFRLCMQDQQGSSTNGVEETRNKRPEEDEEIVIPAPTQEDVYGDETNQSCEICGDKFEQFWDEEDEIWKLKNARILAGKIYHPLCCNDIANAAQKVVNVGLEDEPVPSDVEILSQVVRTHTNPRELAYQSLHEQPSTAIIQSTEISSSTNGASSLVGRSEEEEDKEHSRSSTPVRDEATLKVELDE